MKEGTVFPPLWGEPQDPDDPEVEEARQLEFEFLRAIDKAQVAFEKILITKAWKKLGFDTFARWWKVRVVPTMHALHLKPVDDIRDAGIKQVLTEDAELPPAQRHTRKEIGEMFGCSEATVGRRAGTRSTGASTDAGSDLVTRIDEEIQAVVGESHNRAVTRSATHTEVVRVLLAAGHEFTRAMGMVRGQSFDAAQVDDLLNILDRLNVSIAALREAIMTSKL